MADNNLHDLIARLRALGPHFDRGHNRPVAAGLAAMVAACAVVVVFGGIVAGLGLLIFSGAGDDSNALDPAKGGTLVLPLPSDTPTLGGPLVTLSADPDPTTPAEPETSSSAPETSPAATDSAPADPGKQPISLSASPTHVGALERVDLTGVYAGGEGAILQVQRFEDGAWTDFDVTVSVSGGIFSTFIQTGRLGAQDFRVIDTDTGAKSNSVTVTVS